MTNNPFREAVFTALRNSYSECQVLNLSFDGNVTNMVEYFITVNLCKELLNWNEKNHYPYKIEAEKKTEKLYKDCFENCRRLEESIFSPTIFASETAEFKNNLQGIRKGKVDIAISSENMQRNFSEYIYEVKAVNPVITELEKDFQRIQQFLNTEIPNFENSLKGGFIVFIKHHNDERKIQEKVCLQRVQKDYLSGVKSRLDKIKSSNIVFEIDTEDIILSDGRSLHIFDGFDFGEAAYNTYIAYGVIISIQKLNQTLVN